MFEFVLAIIGMITLCVMIIILVCVLSIMRRSNKEWTSESLHLHAKRGKALTWPLKEETLRQKKESWWQSQPWDGIIRLRGRALAAAHLWGSLAEESLLESTTVGFMEKNRFNDDGEGPLLESDDFPLGPDWGNPQGNGPSLN